jgi:Cu(I)/Ag(I) efflux system membrane protein CusA/SilA
LSSLQLLPIVTDNNLHIVLADIAQVKIVDGPPVIKSENARLNGWSLVDIVDRDIGSYVEEAKKLVEKELVLPAGYSLQWSGQYEYMVRAKEKLSVVIPITLGIIVLLLYFNFRRFHEVAIIIGTLPLAMGGALWLLYILDFHFSVAVGVGFIALAGVTAEIGIIMLVYLNQAYDQMMSTTDNATIEDIKQAVVDGAGKRVRPVMMTVAAIIAGLLPIMYGDGTGSQIMQRIAAPMLGGMISAVVLTLLVLPSVYFLWKSNSRQ